MKAEEWYNNGVGLEKAHKNIVIELMENYAAAKVKEERNRILGIAAKLKDNIHSLGNEYRISERWREHLLELIDDLTQKIKGE